MQGPLFPFEYTNVDDAFVQILEPISGNHEWDNARRCGAREHDGCWMMTTTTYAQARTGRGIYARAYSLGAFLRRCGASLLMGLHEQRRREAARIVAGERYLSGPGGTAWSGADARPKVVPLRRSPATQPSQDCGAS